MAPHDSAPQEKPSLYSPSSLWTLLFSHQGETFTTARGVPFSYRIGTRDGATRDGGISGEMFIVSDTEGSDAHTNTIWSRKSLTVSTVYKAYTIACEIVERGEVLKGPKQLKVFGRQFIYPILCGLEVIESRSHDGAGQTHVTQIHQSQEAPCVSHSADQQTQQQTQYAHSQLSLFCQEEEDYTVADTQVESIDPVVEGETKKTRSRRPSAQVKAEKIAAVEEKIAKKEREIAELKQQLEELKRPPKLSERERQELFKTKVAEGVLTEEEAYQLGWKG